MTADAQIAHLEETAKEHSSEICALHTKVDAMRIKVDLMGTKVDLMGMQVNTLGMKTEAILALVQTMVGEYYHLCL